MRCFCEGEGREEEKRDFNEVDMRQGEERSINYLYVWFKLGEEGRIFNLFGWGYRRGGEGSERNIFN
jgi:hypothetical protein